MKKQLTATLAALLMTACVGIAMLGIGGVALFNKNGETPSNSPGQAAQVSQVNSSADVQQLQNLVSQYQAREQQYQQQLEQANSQLETAQRQMQQVQLLLAALQQRGLITVTGNGQIIINR